jgi:hypothetical protein
MITSFHRPETRSSRFIFLLEELEAPYQIKLVTTRTRDGTGAADPANPHPHGRVPTTTYSGLLHGRALSGRRRATTADERDSFPHFEQVK